MESNTKTKQLSISEEIKNEYKKNIQHSLSKKIYDVIEINKTEYILDPHFNHVYNINNEFIGIKYDTGIIFFKDIDEIINKSTQLNI